MKVYYFFPNIKAHNTKINPIIVCTVNGSFKNNEEKINPKIGHRNKKKEALIVSILISLSQIFTAKIETGPISQAMDNNAGRVMITGFLLKKIVRGNIKMPPNNTCQPFKANRVRLHFLEAKYKEATL